ncbi:uncharacterized protein DNG_06300 [Cephalotrichum gorgonifer]|uniref:Thioredoxin domain-containing protein n=1 Tax=Cephalotrichum gorgonifer TaxID=2041049 RepID=A0AAE8SX53_9PEZI|nr:uncharacterized protein DNG_06300 [Cephalotrichum gorgonifer]
MYSTGNYLRFICAAALAVSPSFGWTFTASSELDALIRSQEGTLVAFVMPNLAACKKLEPQWDIVREKEPAAAAVVDCSAEPEYCLAQDVRTHPAVRLYFPDGTYRRYRGPRKADGILPFFGRARQRAWLSPPADSASFLDSDPVAILALFPAKESGGDNSALLHESYADAAYRYGDRYSFGLRVVEDVGEGFRLKCQNNRDKMAYETADLSKVSAIDRFMGKSMVHYFPSSEADREAYVATVRPLAKRYKEYLNFLTVDPDEYPDMAASLGHVRGARGVLAVQNPHTWQAFPFDEGAQITAAAVEEFIMGISRGEVEAWDGREKERGAKGARSAHDEL